jgi:hypothetical protein
MNPLEAAQITLEVTYVVVTTDIQALELMVTAKTKMNAKTVNMIVLMIATIQLVLSTVLVEPVSRM